MKISKIVSAKNQIETGIYLYELNLDPVSIHTLTTAAHQVLSDISKKSQGAKHFIRNENILKQYLKTEFIPEYFRRITNAQRFFKHSDNINENQDSEIDFNPDINDFFLMDSILTYQSLTDDVSIAMLRLLIWIYIKYPNLSSSQEIHDLISKMGKVEKDIYFKLSKKEPILNYLNIIRQNWINYQRK